MFKLKCDKCDGSITLDIRLTNNDYIQTMDYLVDSKGEVDINTIQTYMIYSCVECSAKYKFELKDIEQRIRKEIAQSVITIRRDQELDRFSCDIDDDIEEVLKFCGKCPGIHNDGRCFKVIMAKCKIRNKDYGI